MRTSRAALCVKPPRRLERELGHLASNAHAQPLWLFDLWILFFGFATQLLGGVYRDTKRTPPTFWGISYVRLPI